jgi:nucleotide-binding universal stress UspA family protein
MGYGKILITLDGSPLAERALEQVLTVAAPSAQVHLLSILGEALVTDLSAMSAIAQSGPLSDHSWQTLYADVSKEKRDRAAYLNKVAIKLVQAGLTVTCEVRQGDAVEEIAEVAKGGFDVLLIATHSRRRLGRAIFGSVTEGVLHHVTCPILIVPNSAASAE